MSDYFRWEMKQYWMLWVELTTNLLSYRRPKIARETMFFALPVACTEYMSVYIKRKTTIFAHNQFSRYCHGLWSVSTKCHQADIFAALSVGRLVRRQDGASCEYNGKTYQDGERTGEGCGHCTCLDGGMACSGKGVQQTLYLLGWGHGLLG